eukprot:c24474_g1_i1 orf=152-1498(-)
MALLCRSSFMAFAFLLLLSVFSHNLPSSLAQEPPMVFAHYMLYSFLYSDDVAGFTKEIQLAQSHGIDAFALNTPAWNPTLQTRADNLYQAAENLGFKLFFSADFNSYDGSLTLDNIRTMLTRYANYSSQLTYQGKQFLSTFEGSTLTVSPYTDALSTWRDGVLNPAGGNIFFVPCFLVASGDPADIANVINEFNPILSGLLAWDVSGWPYVDGSISDAADKAYLSALGDAGKVYMASVSPWFFRTDASGGVRGNYQGDGLWRQNWENLIALKPPLVEILTWNDWAERTYVVAVSASNNPIGAVENNDQGFPHLAYLDLAGRYFIPWYKTGQQPTIDSASKEALYIFYYTQSKEGSSVRNADLLDDKVYATVLLFEAADVILSSGTQSQTFSNVQAGMQSVSMAFSTGQQSVKVVRNGAEVLSITGALSIESPPASQDFNVYSAYQTAT